MYLQLISLSLSFALIIKKLYNELENMCKLQYPTIFETWEAKQAEKKQLMYSKSRQNSPLNSTGTSYLSETNSTQPILSEVDETFMGLSPEAQALVAFTDGQESVERVKIFRKNLGPGSIFRSK